MKYNPFRTSFAENIFRFRYAQGSNDSWKALSRRIVEDVCGRRWGSEPLQLLSNDDQAQLIQYITEMKFVPGGRYLYYAGRQKHFYNNCAVLIGTEDSREQWAELAHNATSWLMSGAGIGVEYSVFRPAGRVLSSSGGVASGPIPLMYMVNEIARNVIQGGSRRSACWAGLHWEHEDILDFLKIKDWSKDVIELKAKDFNFPAPLDMTNVSIGWDNEFLDCIESGDIPDLWYDSCARMLKTGEPGHSYNFYEFEHEVGRNACNEVCSEYDSDVCNLGSLNLSRIDSKEELQDVAYLASKFLVCGTLRADLPYQKCFDVRNKTRRIGLGIMGVHEWLLARGHDYSMNEELSDWLKSYVEYSEKGANEHCDRFYLQRPIKYRAIAPNGTVGIVCSTTTGIEPIFALAYKRRYLLNGSRWQYEYVIDATAEYIKEKYDLDSDKIETAYSLAVTPEKRIKFQYDMQQYIDQGISSTVNLPAWGTEYNNEDRVKEFSDILLKYCHGLRGITCYPDGSRGGQPLVEVPYEEAKKGEGVIHDETETKCSGSICGM
jgi:ribonucleoside-diphosphate reductase alpha chain